MVVVGDETERVYIHCIPVYTCIYIPGMSSSSFARRLCDILSKKSDIKDIYDGIWERNIKVPWYSKTIHHYYDPMGSYHIVRTVLKATVKM